MPKTTTTRTERLTRHVPGTPYTLVHEEDGSLWLALDGKPVHRVAAYAPSIFTRVSRKLTKAALSYLRRLDAEILLGSAKGAYAL